MSDLENKGPHPATLVYSSRKFNHWKKIFQLHRERDKSRGQWILLGLLVVFAVFGGSFLGFILQTTVINPPTQVIGVCPPPAFVSGNDCFQNVSTTDAQGNVHVSVQPAGTIIGPGATRTQCNGNVCVAVP